MQTSPVICPAFCWWKLGLFPIVFCFLFSPMLLWTFSYVSSSSYVKWFSRCITWGELLGFQVYCVFSFTRLFQIVFLSDSINSHCHGLHMRVPITSQPPQHLYFQTVDFWLSGRYKLYIPGVFPFIFRAEGHEGFVKDGTKWLLWESHHPKRTWIFRL